MTDKTADMAAEQEGREFSRKMLREMLIYNDTGGKELDLSNSKLHHVPPALLSMDNIDTLDLSDNPNLLKLPDEFSKLTKLRNLSLLQCGLTKFPAILNTCYFLEHLRVSVNALQVFPVSLSEMYRLTSIELVMCGLTEIPNSLTTLPNLEFLDLQCNKIATLPHSMKNMAHLAELDLSSNELATFPTILCQIVSLQCIRLSRNKISSIPAAVNNLDKLMDLRMSWNKLKSIPPELCHLDLHVLHLDSNRITFLPHMFVNMKNLGVERDSFIIEDNPIVNPPRDVCQKGVDAIRDYLVSMA